MRYKNTARDEREARSRLAQLVHRKQFIYGSIVTSKRRCGKANCWCKKKEGAGHVSSYLSVKIGKDRKMIFIPQGMVEKVREWTMRYQEINQQLVKISESCVKRIREE
ncbi:MAG: hypothetical protein KAI72_04070 [Candidatus Pacebacteria bacterium]|nr:hypothetical protein [Candidatus Paceibacterota bacterium]